MDENKQSIAVKKLLNNDSFVLWVLSPTDKTDRQWKQWMADHPGRTEEVEAARRIVCSAQLNSFSLSDEQSEALFNRIEQSYSRRRQKRILFKVGYVAAGIALAFLIGSQFTLKENEPVNIQNDLFAALQIDSTQTEIELAMPAVSKIVQVENAATIRQMSSGTIKINNDTNDAVPVATLIALEEKVAAVLNAREEKKSSPITEKPMNVLKVPIGRHSSVVLSDGTKAWVNSGSVLSFPSTFDTNNRTVFVSGEVFLEVVKDASRPFYVKTSRMDVQVLGTSFNVMAYNNDQEQSVVLVEGSITVSDRTNRNYAIKPNEMFVLGNDTAVISQVVANNYTSWRDGVLTFDKSELGDVLQRISRYYGVKIEYPNELRERRCSGKLFLTGRVTDVMSTIEESMALSCENEGGIIKLKI